MTNTKSSYVCGGLVLATSVVAFAMSPKIGLAVAVALALVIATTARGLWFELTVAAAFGLAIAYAIGVAKAGQLIDCRAVPPSEDGSDGRWIYRFVEGRTCWFEANGLRRGREKPLEELRWPSYVEIFSCPDDWWKPLGN